MKQIKSTKKAGIRQEKGSFIKELSKNRILFIMLLPTFLYFLMFFYLPFVGAYFGFVDYKIGLGLFKSPFVGFQNFKFLISSNTLLKLTCNTLLYNIVFILVGNFFQIVVAILISFIGFKTYKRFCQTMIFLPYFISYVLVGVFAYGMMNFEFGIINSMLDKIGISPLRFYSTPAYWKYILTATHIWKWLGYGSVIYLAAITSINPVLYEVAAIDGANVFRQIRSVTLPMLKPTIIMLLLFSVGGILKGQFELFYQMVGRNGLLYNATDIIDTYVYRALRETAQLELGTAAGLYQSVFGLMIILIVNYIIKKTEPEYALF
jgi:putative aldouronate transport system permease protein